MGIYSPAARSTRTRLPTSRVLLAVSLATVLGYASYEYLPLAFACPAPAVELLDYAGLPKLADPSGAFEHDAGHTRRDSSPARQRISISGTSGPSDCKQLAQPGSGVSGRAGCGDLAEARLTDQRFARLFEYESGSHERSIPSLSGVESLGGGARETRRPATFNTPGHNAIFAYDEALILSNPRAVNATRGIATPFGRAVQGSSEAALAARTQVQGGATMWRIGTTGKSAAGEAQFWSLEHPLSPGFASRHGIPAQNVANSNFIESATLRSGTDFVTRVAPGVGSNVGGGIEVVVPQGGVMLRGFSAF